MRFYSTPSLYHITSHGATDPNSAVCSKIREIEADQTHPPMHMT
uniref:Uncharacterized protein n=1 Tax=Arundo donax TaxID=35708 RepID=A0A0A9G3J3_ARUDO